MILKILSDSQQTILKNNLKILAEDLGLNQSLQFNNLQQLKKEIVKNKEMDHIPSNSEIFNILPKNKRKYYSQILKIKPTKTASGIAVISVMTKPYNCPHGVCIFCPGGEKIGTPQSYLPTEPATMRALEVEFDPFNQVKNRMVQLKGIGHEIDKVELLIIGGTFMNLPVDYQENFIKSCFDALNGKFSNNIKTAHKIGEKSIIRNVGLGIETKPDWCKEQHIDRVLSFGATRIEIGVQTLSDEIFKRTNRDHTLKDVIESFRIAKDSGFKIVAHMMPGLPGSNFNKDLEDFKTLFSESNFKPDMLKIYPTLVVPGTGLSKMYKKGLYKPYNTQTVINLLTEVKKDIPQWVRIMRIQREISKSEIEAGVDKGNIRELIFAEMKRKGYKCKCIRCREIGLKQLKERFEINHKDVTISKKKYKASEGYEYFISAEDQKSESLIGFARLRIPSIFAHRKEIDGKTALIRELHVYGQLIPLGKKYNSSWQHKGMGSKLMEEAEKIAKEEESCNKILVISAIGTREYYKKLGYHLQGPYMGKDLR